MKLIVAGSREFDNFEKLENELFNVSLIIGKPKTIVSGKARGADSLGEIYAKKYLIDVEEYPADWDNYGKSAGYRRNCDMANNADVLIAFWDRKSKGTKHMINIALNKGLFVKVVKI